MNSERSREHTRAYKRESYAWYKAHGICPVCHKADIAPGRASCRACLDKQKERYAGRAERVKDAAMARYAQLKAAGLCVKCGHAPSEAGRVTCKACAARVAAYMCQRRKRRAMMDYAESKPAGDVRRGAM